MTIGTGKAVLFPYEHKTNYISAQSVKLYKSWKVITALVIYTYCVTEYAVCSHFYS